MLRVKTMKNESDDLELQYRQSQQRTSAPSRIKRSVMKSSNSQEHSFSFLRFYRSALPLASACIVAVLVVGIVNYTSMFQPEPITAVNVELHDITSNVDDVSEYVIRKNEGYKVFLQNQRSMKVALSRSVTLEKLNGDWLFRDCDDALIKVSEKLVARMSEEMRIAPDVLSQLKIGDQVELAMNEDSIILGIELGKPAMC